MANDGATYKSVLIVSLVCVGQKEGGLPGGDQDTLISHRARSAEKDSREYQKLYISWDGRCW